MKDNLFSPIEHSLRTLRSTLTFSVLKNSFNINTKKNTTQLKMFHSTQIPLHWNTFHKLVALRNSHQIVRENWKMNHSKRTTTTETLCQSHSLISFQTLRAKRHEINGRTWEQNNSYQWFPSSTFLKFSIFEKYWNFLKIFEIF